MKEIFEITDASAILAASSNISPGWRTGVPGSAAAAPAFLRLVSNSKAPIHRIHKYGVEKSKQQYPIDQICQNITQIGAPQYQRNKCRDKFNREQTEDY